MHAHRRPSAATRRHEPDQTLHNHRRLSCASRLAFLCTDRAWLAQSQQRPIDRRWIAPHARVALFELAAKTSALWIQDGRQLFTPTITTTTALRHRDRISLRRRTHRRLPRPQPRIASPAQPMPRTSDASPTRPTTALRTPSATILQSPAIRAPRVLRRCPPPASSVATSTCRRPHRLPSRGRIRSTSINISISISSHTPSWDTHRLHHGLRLSLSGPQALSPMAVSYPP